METPTAPSTTPEKTGTLTQFLWDLVVTLTMAVLFYLALDFLTARVYIRGHSMFPTFQGGEMVLAFRPAYHLFQPQRGDIVIYSPPGHTTEYIKRIIALEGEEVLIEKGRVYINGRLLNEPYINEPPRYEGYWKVPSGHVFVLGDNRNYSADSHSMGPVPLNHIKGKVVLVYWPPQAWRWLWTPPYR